MWLNLVFGNDLLNWEIFWILYLLTSQTYTWKRFTLYIHSLYAQMKSNRILTVQKIKGNPECSETTISCWGRKTEELSVVAFSVAALEG